MLATLNTKIFQRLLLHWFDRYGRKDLPWQQHKTPYRVWISEVMLQQTQVSTVIGYFLRFVQEFPSLQTLAAAQEDRILHLWTGLGYYQRARNLQKTAKILCDQHQGEFPTTQAELQTLPGIGRTTAAAILAIGLNKKAAILDGNVKRVMMRLHGLENLLSEKKTIDKLWDLAEQYTPKYRVADYTQAIMDFGATLCSRKNPRCHECPFNKYCLAFIQNKVHLLPRSKPRKKLPIRQSTFLIMTYAEKIFLEKRGLGGVWAGLWSFPELPYQASLEEIKTTCRDLFSVTPKKIQLGQSFRHTFTHFHLDIRPVFIEIKKPLFKTMAKKTQIWYKSINSPKIGLPLPVKLLLEKSI